MARKIFMIIPGYILSSVALLLFSYTQVDLNLTLSRASVLKDLQSAFQYIGFYQRPWATGFYICILVLLFTFYYLLLKQTINGRIREKQLWGLIFTVTVILVFSYPAAFSYDFFNYLFTAKTVLVYHQNPYAVTPLGFAGVDPWTNFMRWTHLTSAYTPFWIFMSLVPYLVGLGYFITVLFSTKIFIAGFYLLACFALWKATKSIRAVSVFALNPLVLVESLVSSHNDIVMVAFVLLAVAYRNNWFFWALSVATKLMTLSLLPVFWLKKNAAWMLGAMLVSLAAVLTRREFLPWYWVWIMPFVALNSGNNRVLRASFIVSAGLLFSYVPYVYFGDYSSASQIIKTGVIWGSVLLAIVSTRRTY